MTIAGGEHRFGPFSTQGGVASTNDNDGEGYYDENSAGFEGLSADQVVSALRRHFFLLAKCVAVSAFIGFAYTKAAVPLYTGQASLFLDVSKNPIIAAYAENLPTEEEEEKDGSMLSQIELMRSRAVGLAVIEKLKLDQNPEFLGQTESLSVHVFDAVASNLPFAAPKPSFEQLDPNVRRELALKVLDDGGTIKRVAQSYIFDVRFTSPFPELSAAVANALCEAYIEDRISSKADTHRRANEWLTARLEELRQKTREDDLAVEKYKTDNNLLQVGDNLLSETRVLELTRSLNQRESETASARARYEEIDRLLKSGQQRELIVSDVLSNRTSNNLRLQYLDIENRLEQLRRTNGEGHERVIAMRQELRDLGLQLRGEFERIADSYKNDYDVALSREGALRDTVIQAGNASLADRELEVKLRELMRIATSTRQLYEFYLGRYEQTFQQKTFDVTNARIISSATTPENPGFPRLPFVLFLAVSLGATTAGLLAAHRESRDIYFRDGRQLTEETGLELLGEIPEFKIARDKFPAQREHHIESEALTFVIDQPLSPFAEALRATKLAVDMQQQDRRSKIVAFTSALPQEGKSMIAANFAALLADQGYKTLLVDAELRNSTLSKSTGHRSRIGLVDVLVEKAELDDCIIHDDTSLPDFLPAGFRSGAGQSSQLLGSARMAATLESAAKTFDYVILDLPPLASAVDARAVERAVDHFVFIVAKPATARDAVSEAMFRSIELHRKCLGILFNHV